MTLAIITASAVFGAAAAVVCCVTIGAHLWRTRERSVLAVGLLVACLVLLASCFSLVVIGDNEARLIMNNESPWPMRVSALNVESRAIEPGESHEFVVSGGPGWINGLIDDIEILGGADLSSRVLVQGLTEGSTAEITVREETFSPATADR